MVYVNVTPENHDRIKHIYDINYLKDLDRYCRNDLERLNELIEKVKAFQMKLYDHVQDVLQTDFYYIVRLRRYCNWSTKKVEYYVNVHRMPKIEAKQIEGNFIYGEHIENHHFKGTERHIAIKLADELSKKYHCAIERDGFQCNVNLD